MDLTGPEPTGATTDLGVLVRVAGSREGWYTTSPSSFRKRQVALDLKLGRR